MMLLRQVEKAEMKRKETFHIRNKSSASYPWRLVKGSPFMEWTVREAFKKRMINGGKYGKGIFGSEMFFTRGVGLMQMWNLSNFFLKASLCKYYKVLTLWDIHIMFSAILTIYLVTLFKRIYDEEVECTNIYRDTFDQSHFSASRKCEHHCVPRLQVPMLRDWAGRRGAGWLRVREIQDNPLHRDAVCHRPGGSGPRSGGEWEGGHTRFPKHVMQFPSLPHITFHLATFYRPVSFIGITLIAFGTGGIKPCVVTFGADQFKVDWNNWDKT